MKNINKRQFLITFGFLLIVTCTFTKVYGQTIEVVSLDTFSTANPPKEVSVKILEPLTVSENNIYQAGTVLKGNLVDVVSPKRLKRDASFSFEPKTYNGADGKTQKMPVKLKGTYTIPLDKGNLAKNVTLGVGNYFVKGLSMGVAAVSGAIKNEDDNRIKSSATAVYEASPLSYVEKGEDLDIKKDDHFFLKFSSKENKTNDSNTGNKTNETKGQNYSYTTEKE